MTAETNKEVVRTFYDAINRRDFGALSAYCHEDFVFYHQMDTPHPSMEGFIASEKKNFDAFDDWQMPIRDMIAEGEKVAVYLVFDGTHISEHQGIAPTGKRLRFWLLMLLTMTDGKIIEKRAHFDRLDIRNQLAN